MFDWENLRHFVAVARAGTLSGAARALNVDHATVGRRVAALEAELQVRLLDRLPRRCSLTAAGEQILELATEMEADAYAIERALRADQPHLVGTVVVSAPPVLVTNFFAPAAAAFRTLHPGIQLALSGEAQSVSLSRREADIAVRLVRPTESGNVTRHLGTLEFALYAAQNYVHRLTPSKWEFIAYDSEFDATPQQEWLRKTAGHRPIACKISDITSHYAAACNGAGVAGLPSFLPRAGDGLVRLDTEAESFSREIWLVVHRDLKSAPAIRAVMDFIIDLVESTPALQTAQP
jgi:DNA-binding transcriptional LysR family regulator